MKFSTTCPARDYKRLVLRGRVKSPLPVQTGGSNYEGCRQPLCGGTEVHYWSDLVGGVIPLTTYSVQIAVVLTLSGRVVLCGCTTFEPCDAQSVDYMHCQ